MDDLSYIDSFQTDQAVQPELETTESDSSRYYEVKTVQVRHQAMIRLKAAGLTNIEIAEILKVTPQNVSDVLNSPLVQDRLSELQGDLDNNLIEAHKNLERLAINATEHCRKILQDEVESSQTLKTKVALEVLDRIGLGKTHKVESKSLSYSLTRKDIEEIKAQNPLKKASSGEDT